MAKKTEEKSGEYAPLPEQIILINSQKWGYLFDRLTFAQVTLAEERARLRLERQNYLEDNPQILNREIDPEYLVDMAAILFVPIENKKWQVYDRIAHGSTVEEMLKMPGKHITTVEAAIVDFFTLRGKRSIASESLGKNRQAMAMIKRLGSLAKPISGNDSLTAANSTAE